MAVFGPLALFSVLNLIITGIPSILKVKEFYINSGSFKPYYNWNTFNTGDNDTANYYFQKF